MIDIPDNIMTMMITKPQLYQRQLSDESYSSNTSSPSKTHRRTSSSIGFMMWSEGLGDSDCSGEIKSNNAAMDPLNMSWSPSGSIGLSLVPMMDGSYSSSSSKSEHKFHGGDHEEDESVLRALELIRELSFCSSPLPHKMKKRADTAETEEISSHSSEESDRRMEEEVVDRKHDESPIGLVNLKQLHDLRRASPSPLVGLQYLPEYSYI